MSRKGATWTIVLFVLTIVLPGGAREENGRDFIEEARLIFVATACGNGQVPAGPG
jgi:hypothetical protein